MKDDNDDIVVRAEVPLTSEQYEYLMSLTENEQQYLEDFIKARLAEKLLGLLPSE